MPEITILDKGHDRAGFDCGVPGLNTFLKATARQHGKKGISRTFVLTDGSPTILVFLRSRCVKFHQQHFRLHTPEPNLPMLYLRHALLGWLCHGRRKNSASVNCY